MFLNVKNLIKSYSKLKLIIKKLDFSVKKGEIISLSVKVVQEKQLF